MVYVLMPEVGQDKAPTVLPKICRAIIDNMDEIPIAPRLYTDQFLDKNDRDDKYLIARVGQQLAGGCKEVWVFLEEGQPEPDPMNFMPLYGMRIVFFDYSLSSSGKSVRILRRPTKGRKLT